MNRIGIIAMGGHGLRLHVHQAAQTSEGQNPNPAPEPVILLRDDDPHELVVNSSMTFSVTELSGEETKAEQERRNGGPEEDEGEEEQEPEHED